MSLVKNDANHEPIASVFNLLSSDAELVIPVLEELMLKHLSKRAHILDIGCSNGKIVQQLQIRGYQTTGLDVSEELLRFARTNAPEGEFILGDIRNFKSPPTYDAVYSKNVFSFFLNLDELTTVFQNVYAAMHDNALFVFSMASADITSHDDEPQDSDRFNVKDLGSHDGEPQFLEGYTVNEKFVYIERSKYNPEERIRKIEVTTFELINGIWKRSDSTVLEKDYFLSEIKSALENVGFIEINDYNSKDFGDAYKTDDRLCVVCRKPSLSQ
ncbi:class I SAM-dependent methyltransferase [Nostoc sp.]|uniref:class I SAM-dependent methyltransferase n=1 Tax=Nostoc sp. TaxID=1180 RepID=UPI002FEFB220